MFCPKCGNGIGREKDAPTEPAKRNRKGILAAAVIAVAVAIVIGWVVADWHGLALSEQPSADETLTASVSNGEKTISLLYPAAWGEPEVDSSSRFFGEYLDSSQGVYNDDNYTSFGVFMLQNDQSIPWEKVEGLWEDFCETDSTMSVFPNHELVSTMVSGRNALQWRGDVSIDSNGEQLRCRLAVVLIESQGYLCGGAQGSWLAQPNSDIGEEEFNAIMDSVSYSELSDDLPRAYSSTTYTGPGVAPPGMYS